MSADTASPARPPETENIRWDAARAAMARLEASAERMTSRQFAGIASTVLAIALFLTAGLVLNLTLGELAQRLDVVRQSEDAMSEIDALQAALGDAILSARGFVVGENGGDAATLAKKRALVVARMNALGQLAGNEPAARQQTTALSVAVSDIMAEISGARPLKGDASRAPALVAFDRRLIELSRSLNSRIAALRSVERANVALRQKLAEGTTKSALWIALIAAIAAPACGILGIVLLLRERASNRAREIHSELMHAQRLAMMGETSSMLAHEINQPLAAATNYVAALQRLLAAPVGASPDKLIDVTQRASQQLQRTSNVLKRLRNFIEKRDNERGIENPSVLIEDCTMLLVTIDSTIPLRTHIEPDLPLIVIDRVQLQQVVVNLMRNAVEAMRQSPTRELTLSVEALDASQVQFSLADTGPGLAKDVAERLFKPFVSTKQDGMGIGLSICRGIIAAHGGRIWADPNPEGGTVFRFTIPALREAAAA